MLVLSLDLGKYNSMACLMDSDIREPQFLTIATDRHYLGTLLRWSDPLFWSAVMSIGFG